MPHPVYTPEHSPAPQAQPFTPSDYDESAAQLDGQTDPGVARIAAMLRFAALVIRERNAVEAELEELLAPAAHPIARSVARLVVTGAAGRLQ